MRRATPLLIACALSTACKSERDLFDQVNTDAFAQAPSNEVDILWVIDDSASMAEEQATLVAGFASFADQLEASATEFHLGVISTSFDYLDYLRSRQMLPSVGATGICWDNAVAESFWSSLKRELIHRHRFVDRAGARRAIFRWINTYNHRRLHSSLRYQTPIAWENQYRPNPAARTDRAA